MSPAKRRLSGPARTLTIRLTRSKAAVWTVDDVARLFIYLLLPLVAYDPEDTKKLDQ